MIRPAEIRALYSRLQEGGPFSKDDPRSVFAAALKSGMSRLWADVEIPPNQMTARGAFHNNGAITVDVFWRETMVFSVCGENVSHIDSRFLVKANDGRFSVRRFLADEWPELEKPAALPGP